jgi:GT2 family glycosyltransferase
MKKTAIVILNWNGKLLLEKFLPSLLNHTPPEDADIVVADNGSTDDSVAFVKTRYPRIILYTFSVNYGFAEGYNKVLAGLDYEYVVLLNSDVEVTAGWLRPAIDYMAANKEIAALQPKIMSYCDRSFFEYAGACGGFLDIYGYPFCRGRIFDTIEKDCKQYDSVIQIFWASGACFFVRLKDFKEAGGFDPHFFAHQEEIDLCWRINMRMKKIVCFPQSCVYHVGGASLDKNNPKKNYLNFRNNLLMLYKNLPDSYYKRILFIRFFLDYLSAFLFLLKRQPQNAIAVRKARNDFLKTKNIYKTIREENLSLSKNKIPETIFRSSIIRQYYFRFRKNFDSLKW